jgi:hypothetical protein
MDTTKIVRTNKFSKVEGHICHTQKSLFLYIDNEQSEKKIWTISFITVLKRISYVVLCQHRLSGLVSKG